MKSGFVRSKALAILMLAMCLGLTASSVSIVYSLLYKNLPMVDADAVVTIWETRPQSGGALRVASSAEFRNWREGAVGFVQMGAFYRGTVVASDRPTPEKLEMAYVSQGFFETLGAKPIGGRLYSRSDETATAHVAIVSKRLWNRYFENTPFRTTALTLDNVKVQIVGVVDDKVAFPAGVEVWRPLALAGDTPSSQRFHYLSIIARRDSTVPDSAAKASVAIRSAQLADTLPSNRGHSAVVVPLREYLIGDLRNLPLLFYGASAVMLVLGGASVTMLMLSRAVEYRTAIATQMALGAPLWRILWQFVRAAAGVVIPGYFAGMAVAWITLSLAPALEIPLLPELGSFELGFPVIAISAAVAFIMLIFTSLLPAILLVRRDLVSECFSAGRQASWTGGLKYQRFFVAVQFACTVILLSTVGLLLRTAHNLVNVDPGFRTEGVLTVPLSLGRERYGNRAAIADFFGRTIADVKRMPGVHAAAAVASLPLSGAAATQAYAPRQRHTTLEEAPRANINIVTDDYFRAMGIPLVRGRLFGAQDSPGQPVAAIVNELVLPTITSGGSLVGDELTLLGSNGPQEVVQIVGVVRNVRQVSISEAPRPEIYLSFSQRPMGSMVLVVKSTMPSGALNAQVLDVIRQQDPAQALAGGTPMAKLVDDSIANKTDSIALLSVFAIAAVLIAGLGLFGIVSFVAAQRRWEIALRTALGGEGRSILKQVFFSELFAAGVGAAIGLAGSLAVTRLLEATLFNVSPNDPLTFAASAIVLSLVAVLAVYLPIQRALNVKPGLLLRQL